MLSFSSTEHESKLKLAVSTRFLVLPETCFSNCIFLQVFKFYLVANSTVTLRNGSVTTVTKLSCPQPLPCMSRAAFRLSKRCLSWCKIEDLRILGRSCSVCNSFFLRQSQLKFKKLIYNSRTLPHTKVPKKPNFETRPLLVISQTHTGDMESPASEQTFGS